MRGRRSRLSPLARCDRPLLCALVWPHCVVLLPCALQLPMVRPLLHHALVRVLVPSAAETYHLSTTAYSRMLELYPRFRKYVQEVAKLRLNYQVQRTGSPDRKESLMNRLSRRFSVGSDRDGTTAANQRGGKSGQVLKASTAPVGMGHAQPRRV